LGEWLEFFGHVWREWRPLCWNIYTLGYLYHKLWPNIGVMWKRLHKPMECSLETCFMWTRHL
jgi:hypothetical protein